MAGGAAGRINKPKAARCKTNLRKLTRQRLKAYRKPHVRSEETLSDTTDEKLRQCRSNPKANVRLSGKKKRLLLKEAKRAVAENNKMEVPSTSVKGSVVRGSQTTGNSERMDTA